MEFQADARNPEQIYIGMRMTKEELKRLTEEMLILFAFGNDPGPLMQVYNVIKQVNKAANDENRIPV